MWGIATWRAWSSCTSQLPWRCRFCVIFSKDMWGTFCRSWVLRSKFQKSDQKNICTIHTNIRKRIKTIPVPYKKTPNKHTTLDTGWSTNPPRVKRFTHRGMVSSPVSSASRSIVACHRRIGNRDPKTSRDVPCRPATVTNRWGKEIYGEFRGWRFGESFFSGGKEQEPQF